MTDNNKPSTCEVASFFTMFQHVLEQAVNDMEYGGIAINSMPPFIFLNPYLTWGGNEEENEIVSVKCNPIL